MRGIIDQDVEAAEFVDSPAQERLAVRFLADVSGQYYSLTAGFFDP